MAIHGKRVFISHSSKDRDTASKLVEFLEAGLILKPEEIRCTSVSGYRLPAGSHTSETLRKEINSAELIIGIITPHSVESEYVLFELGASWVLNKPTFPLLAKGAETNILPGPLKERHAPQLSDLDQVHQIRDDIAKLTTIKTGGVSAIINAKAQALRKAAFPRLAISLFNADKRGFAAGEKAKWGDASGPPCCNFHLSVRNRGAEEASDVLVELVAIRKPPYPTAPNLLTHAMPLEKAANPSDETPVLIGPGESKIWNLGFLLSHLQEFMLAAVERGRGPNFRGVVTRNGGLLAEVQVSGARRRPEKIRVKISWDDTPFDRHHNAYEVKKYFHVQALRR